MADKNLKAKGNNDANLTGESLDLVNTLRMKKQPNTLK